MFEDDQHPLLAVYTHLLNQYAICWPSYSIPIKFHGNICHLAITFILLRCFHLPRTFPVFLLTFSDADAHYWGSKSVKAEQPRDEKMQRNVSECLRQKVDKTRSVIRADKMGWEVSALRAFRSIPYLPVSPVASHLSMGQLLLTSLR